MTFLKSICLRYFNFDHTRMRTPASAAFESCVLSVLGLQSGKDAPTCMLSSLASELTFNQLRDASRRHAKQGKMSASAIHSVAWKASMLHTMGCETLSLDDADWGTPIKQCSIKKAIHSNHRGSDRELGISSTGLTKHRVNRQYTKPHIFTARLHLLRVLTKLFHEVGGSMEDRRCEVVKVFDSLWISKVVPLLWFTKFAGGDEDPENILLTNRAGPHTVGCLKLSKVNGTYQIDAKPLHYLVVEKLDKCLFAKAKPCIDPNTGNLVWAKEGSWMSLLDWIADHGIFSISPALLLSVCQTMKLQACSKLSHPHRVELFLKHMARTDEWVQHVIENLEPWERKRKQKNEEDEENQETEQTCLNLIGSRFIASFIHSIPMIQQVWSNRIESKTPIYSYIAYQIISIAKVKSQINGLFSFTICSLRLLHYRNTSVSCLDFTPFFLCWSGELLHLPHNSLEDPYEHLEGETDDEALAEVQEVIDEDLHDQIQEAAASVPEAVDPPKDLDVEMAGKAELCLQV